MDNILETAVKDIHFFTNSELGHHLPVIQLLGIDSRIVSIEILYHFHEEHLVH